MAEETNLQLNVHRPSHGAPPVVRISLAYARGYTAEGAPILTSDCSTPAELERETRRLAEEMSLALREAGQELGEVSLEQVASSKPTEVVATDGPHLASDLRVEDVMTRDVRTVGRNEKIAVADEVMRTGRFRHIVVVDDEGVLAGVVSQRDIVFSALSWQLGQGSNAHQIALESVAAKELMQTQLVTIDPEASIAEAASRMKEHKIGCLPVVAGSDLVGIITEGDFLSLLAPA